MRLPMGFPITPAGQFAWQKRANIELRRPDQQSLSLMPVILRTF